MIYDRREQYDGDADVDVSGTGATVVFPDIVDVKAQQPNVQIGSIPYIGVQIMSDGVGTGTIAFMLTHSADVGGPYLQLATSVAVVATTLKKGDIVKVPIPATLERFSKVSGVSVGAVTTMTARAGIVK